MSLVLITREDLEKQSLAHYRTKGSKNGERRYQYEDGSLTPLGRIHYGVGKAKEHLAEKGKESAEGAKQTSEKAKAAAKFATAKYTGDKKKAKLEARAEMARISAEQKAAKAEKLEKKIEKHEQQKANLEKSDAEIKKDVEDKIKAFNEKTAAMKKEHTDQAAAEKKDRQEEISEIRHLSDMELNKRIERLQKEKTLSDLVNQRAYYEQSPVKAKAAKIFSDFAENFARKALSRATDEIINKLIEKGKNGNAVSVKGDINKNNTDNSKPKDNSNNSNNSGNSSGYGSGNRFSKQDKSKIKSMAGSGKSIADIAKALGTTEDRVKGYMSSAGITIK